jgi:hypothetical protein
MFSRSGQEEHKQRICLAFEAFNLDMQWAYAGRIVNGSARWSLCFFPRLRAQSIILTTIWIHPTFAQSPRPNLLQIKSKHQSAGIQATRSISKAWIWVTTKEHRMRTKHKCLTLLNVDDIFILLLPRSRNLGSSDAAASYSSSTPRSLKLRDLIWSEEEARGWGEGKGREGKKTSEARRCRVDSQSEIEWDLYLVHRHRRLQQPRGEAMSTGQAARRGDVATNGQWSSG